MSLDSDILTDLHQLLAEHGVAARWNDIDLLVLASRVKRDQQIDLGGFVDSPELSLRVPKRAFPEEFPKSGQKIIVAGNPYRIVQVSEHPRSPLLTLSLDSADE